MDALERGEPERPTEVRSPLNVAIVAPSLRIMGGHSVQAQGMLDGWRPDPRVSAWLIPINPVPPAPFDRLLRVKYARTILTQLCYWPSLLRQLRRADIAHVFAASSSGFLLSAVPAVLVARALRKPTVLNYHSGAAADHFAHSRFARWMLRRAVDVNVVPSPFLKSVFRSFGLEARVVANAVDPNRFAYRARNPLRPHLLSTRNFEPLYNVACTLRAFARVQARHADATLTVVGAGSQEAALRTLAAELGVRHVTFAGTVSPFDIHRYYAAADIYVQTPSVDNMPLSVLEAFASGLPVVSTAVGGVPTILQHGAHGLLAPDDDDEAVASRVLDLLADPERARRLAEAAHHTCRSYQWPLVREEWYDVYHGVTGSRMSGPARTSAEAA